jgi:uncharacterized membrane protein required for colicin V production
MDLFSTLILILFTFFVIRGAWRGFAGELAPFEGILVCFGIFWYGYTPTQQLIATHFPTLTANACVFYSAITVATLACVGFLLTSLLVRKVVSFILPQPFNAIFGALVGGAKVFLFVSLAGSLFTMGKNKIQEVRDESQRNPFLATAIQFWVDQFSTIHLQQLLTTDEPPASTTPPVEHPAPQKGGL